MSITRYIPGWAIVVEAFVIYPIRSVAIVLCILAGGLAEGLGVVAVLPVLSIAVGDAVTGDAGIGRAIADLMVATGIPTDLPILLAFMVLGFAVKGGLMMLAMQQIGFATAQVNHDLRFDLIRAVMGARWPYYSGQPVGALVNSMTVDISRGGAAFTGAYTVVALTMQVIVYVGLAVLVSWQMALAALIAGIVMMLILGRFIEMSRRASRNTALAFEQLTRRLTDALNEIKPLRAMAVQERLAPLLEAYSQDINRSVRRLIIAKHAVNWLREPILVVFLAIGLYAALGVWSIGMELVLVMALLFYRTATTIGMLQSAYQQVVTSEVYYQRARNKIAEAQREVEGTSGTKSPGLERAVRLEDVSLSLGGREVIGGASLEIKVGKVTVLFGPSGAGKSTLADLVLGLYRPDAGKIWVDNVLLEDIDVGSWRREIGYVPQDTLLFHDTLLKNVTLGDPDLTKESAESALRAAGAWGFVEKRKERMDLILGERGTTISGGERQRIAIARALIRKPRLLILDEPTTALDPETEAGICMTLRKLALETTVLVISHQPALLDLADVAYRVVGGAVTLSHGSDSPLVVPAVSREVAGGDQQG